MANEIILTKGLNLGIVLDMHEKEFEQGIFEDYCFLIENRSVIVPSVREIGYHPKFIHAAFLYGENDGDMDLVNQEMRQGDNDDELMDHCIAELDEIEENDPYLMREYQEGMADDIESVLSFYKMCYASGFYNPFNGTATYYLENDPIVLVW